LSPRQIERTTGLAHADVAAALSALMERAAITQIGDLYLAESEWIRLCDTSRHLLTEYHQQHPLRLGIPREEWRSRLGLSPQELGGILSALAAEGELVEVGGTGQSQSDGVSRTTGGRGTLVRLSGFEPRLTPQQERAVDGVLARFDAEPFAPPLRAEVEAELGAELVALLVERGTLVRVGETLLFSRAAYDEAVRMLVAALRAQGTLTVASARDLLGTSRKYVLPLLEHLDERRITLRRGDDRILGPSAP
jgi:selenocysteine-specific elongation factor